MAKHNLNDYKEAKAMLPHIQAILKLTKLAEKGLEYYRAFLPVAKILTVIREQNSILEAHQIRYVKIIKSKGLYE